MYPTDEKRIKIPADTETVLTKQMGDKKKTSDYVDKESFDRSASNQTAGNNISLIASNKRFYQCVF